MKIRNLINRFKDRLGGLAHGQREKLVHSAAYIAAFAVVLTLVAFSYSSNTEAQISLPNTTASSGIAVSSAQANASAAQTTSSVESAVTTVNDVKAANLASRVAGATNLSSSNSVSTNADSVNVSRELAQADSTSVSKQQITEPTTSSKPIVDYTVKQGDNVATVAAKYSVSEKTVRYANKLTDNNLQPGATIKVPTIEGVTYTVKDGDKLSDLASKYKSDVNSIVAMNNLNSDAAPVGSEIILPGGDLPVEEQPGYVAPTPTHTTTTTTKSKVTTSTLRVPAIGGNTYAYGYCTWYAYNRRVQLGLPVANRWGNANTWDSSARAAGYLVNSVPSAGAIFQYDGGPYGHVGIVERVNADGSVYVSEMNYKSWGVISNRTITRGELSAYEFIH